MWTILQTDEYERRYKKYDKKKNDQLKAVLNNLDILIRSLNSGKRPKPFVYGFLRSEPSGIIAIDQSGAESKVAATRLYIYSDTNTETLYLLTIGIKSTQPDDIENCKRFVQQIKADPGCGGEQDDEYENQQDDEQQPETPDDESDR